jgi:hypothetical protein
MDLCIVEASNRNLHARVLPSPARSIVNNVNLSIVDKIDPTQINLLMQIIHSSESMQMLTFWGGLLNILKAMDNI